MKYINKNKNKLILPVILILAALVLLSYLNIREDLSDPSKSTYAIRWKDGDDTDFSDNSLLEEDTDFSDSSLLEEDNDIVQAPNDIEYPEIDNDTVIDDNDDINTEQNNNAVPASGDGSLSETKPTETTIKKIIALDAGHQKRGNYEEEPIGPGAEVTKPKVSSGTKGVVTGVYEYQLTLAVTLKLEQELINRGYEVYMIRDTNEVNLSNKERADMANKSGADIFLRIHADGLDNPKANGASTLYPSKDNPYVAFLSSKSKALSEAVLKGLCDKTGAKNNGAVKRDDMSGINWCTIPVTIVEMGFMTNPEEDRLMQTEDYQNKIVQGICDGIDAYYAKQQK